MIDAILLTGVGAVLLLVIVHPYVTTRGTLPAASHDSEDSVSLLTIWSLLLAVSAGRSSRPSRHRFSQAMHRLSLVALRFNSRESRRTEQPSPSRLGHEPLLNHMRSRILLRRWGTEALLGWCVSHLITKDRTELIGCDPREVFGIPCNELTLYEEVIWGVVVGTAIRERTTALALFRSTQYSETLASTCRDLALLSLALEVPLKDLHDTPWRNANLTPITRGGDLSPPVVDALAARLQSRCQARLDTLPSARTAVLPLESLSPA